MYMLSQEYHKLNSKIKYKNKTVMTHQVKAVIHQIRKLNNRNKMINLNYQRLRRKKVVSKNIKDFRKQIENIK